MKKTAAFILLISLVCPGIASALSMDEAVSLALEHNHTIKRAEYEHSSAKADVGYARAGFLPTVDLSYTYSRSTEDRYGSGKEQSVFTATAAYNIFAGFSDFNRVREASARAKAAYYQTRSERADLVLAAKAAYTDVLRAESSLLTAREGVELLKRQRDDAALFYREGLIAKNQLLKVEVELASARQKLIEAEGGLRLAVRTLEKVMGTEIAEDTAFEPVSGVPMPADLSYENMKAELMESRSELKYLRKTRDAYSAGAAVAGGGAFPQVDVSMSHNEYGDSPAIGGREGTYDRETVAMLSARWSIFSGGRTYYSRSRLKYLAKAADERLRDTEAELLLQLRAVIEEYEVAKAKLNVAETAVAQAEENYRVTELQFRERVATTTDLLDARTYLTDAKDSYDTSRYDLHLAAAKIERVLERNVPQEDTKKQEKPEEEPEED